MTLVPVPLRRSALRRTMPERVSEERGPLLVDISVPLFLVPARAVVQSCPACGNMNDCPACRDSEIAEASESGPETRPVEAGGETDPAPTDQTSALPPSPEDHYCARSLRRHRPAFARACKSPSRLKCLIGVLRFLLKVPLGDRKGACARSLMPAKPALRLSWKMLVPCFVTSGARPRSPLTRSACSAKARERASSRSLPAPSVAQRTSVPARAVRVDSSHADRGVPLVTRVVRPPRSGR